MDFDFRLDITEVTHVIETADVVAIYFPLLRKTLLIDARVSAVDGPLVKVVPMVQTPEERLKSLRRLRPRFPRPESVTIIPWPKYVGSLTRLGVWEHIVGRFINMGVPEAVRQAEAAYEELETLERQEVHNAVTGDTYNSLWERGAAAGGGEGKGGDGDEEPDGGPAEEVT